MIRRLMRGAIMRRALRPRGFLLIAESSPLIWLMPGLSSSVLIELLAEGLVSITAEPMDRRIEATYAARLEAEIVEDLERW